MEKVGVISLVTLVESFPNCNCKGERGKAWDETRGAEEGSHCDHYNMKTMQAEIAGLLKKVEYRWASGIISIRYPSFCYSLYTYCMINIQIYRAFLP